MNPKSKILLINLGVFITLLFAIELVMMVMGYQPGIIGKNNYFKKVDKLILLDGYSNDSTGIMKINDNARIYTRQYIKNGRQRYRFMELYDFYQQNFCPTPYSTGRDYLNIRQKKVKNDFAVFINRLMEKDTLEEVEQDYLNYVNSPINTDGFRSISFKNHSGKNKQTKIFLLGDSFTWGCTTQNITSSFPDLLSAKGHIIYNTGIVGADLPQYQAIAHQYLKLIRPDFVVVNLYLENDISKFERKLDKERPIFYATNAGNIFSCPHGITFGDPNSAYRQILDIISIPNTDDNYFNLLLSKTRLSTQIWAKLAHLDIIKDKYSEKNLDYWKKVESLEIGYSVNRKYLEQIHAICSEYNSKLIVSIIPAHHDIDISESNIREQLNGFPFSKIETLSAADYAPDGHFNEAGHLKYATFLNELIRQQ